MKFIDVGQVYLINTIYTDNYKACNEVNENLIKNYFQKIFDGSNNLGFGGHVNKLKNILIF